MRICFLLYMRLIESLKNRLGIKPSVEQFIEKWSFQSGGTSRRELEEDLIGTGKRAIDAARVTASEGAAVRTATHLSIARRRGEELNDQDAAALMGESLFKGAKGAYKARNRYRREGRTGSANSMDEGARKQREALIRLKQIFPKK